MLVKPIPDGYHSVTPYLIVSGAAAAIDFYKRAFAEEIMRLGLPDGRVGHAEIRVGNSFIMLADEFPEMGATSPKTLGGVAASFLIYVENADASFKRAVDAGGKEIRPLQNQFYGDRSGTIEDPFGHKWTLGSRIEEISAEEIGKRMAAMMGG